MTVRSENEFAQQLITPVNRMYFEEEYVEDFSERDDTVSCNEFWKLKQIKIDDVSTVQFESF